ncbi:MAG: anhydro-N-acetylmuramic acid kinase [Ferruginibacter sp.]
MLSNIDKLHRIANKSERLIIGLMSGTSLDGLDIALCAITGNGPGTNIQLLRFETIAYTADFRSEVQTVFSKKQIDLEKLCMLNPWIALQHAAMVNGCLQKWNISNEDIDLIASHGQTIYHAPQHRHQQNKFGHATLQIGDADHLAFATGIITISDFRQKNIAAGGEGAPLAVYGDYLLFGKKNTARVLLNVGGIANFTYLPAIDANEKLWCTDVGPGNGLMDAFMQANFTSLTYDKDAALAGTGTIHEALLIALKDDDFFKQPFPKTTGPELFNLQYLQKAMLQSGTNNLSAEDTLATLNKFTADTIASAIQLCVKNNQAVPVYVSGGGLHNPLLMQHLRELLPACDVRDITETGINPDAKEAVLFALLANECVGGNEQTFQGLSDEIPAVSMGKISFPD